MRSILVWSNRASSAWARCAASTRSRACCTEIKSLSADIKPPDIFDFRFQIFDSFLWHRLTATDFFKQFKHEEKNRSQIGNLKSKIGNHLARSRALSRAPRD